MSLGLAARAIRWSHHADPVDHLTAAPRDDVREVLAYRRPQAMHPRFQLLPLTHIHYRGLERCAGGAEELK